MITISLHKKISENKVASHFQLEFTTGDIIGITGPSGKGKTTFLKVIAGLTECDEGEIVYNNNSWLNTSSKVFLPPSKRDIGFVFQDYALFPNMNVLQNIYFARKPIFDDHKLHQLLECFEIKALLDQKVNTLSGGQKQRVAIARALVQLPNILLMDEPFSALDFRIKEQVISYIKQYNLEYKIPIVINTHQIHELSALTNTVYELNAEKLVLLHQKEPTSMLGIVLKVNLENQSMEVEMNQQKFVIPLQKNIQEGDTIQLSISQK
ncbi:ATP-binding cassette domain-containing protein [Flammeovirga sp. SJP92]|uniref:ATP-binding cassette domain-containing protein n=1 Tax=Flammeovirga sp. SJP92 TaxID=1775430 RepID=UPI000788AEC7|nr:ATP-binding cassette domain-containing protein [Flammeovirga sp. SJP92]KXX69197.1 hypothetical protein AVL50_16630 [Flammeovirga sp. SJP92]